MPFLLRFTFNLAVVGLATYLGMFALASLVQPKRHEVVTIVPLKLKPAGTPRDSAATSTASTVEQAGHKQLLTTLENFPFPGR